MQTYICKICIQTGLNNYGQTQADSKLPVTTFPKTNSEL